MRIYVASSWRNNQQPDVVELLLGLGHEVYDFRNPVAGDDGFRAALEHPIAQRGFALDMTALLRCDACVLVLPCGRSAHLELGWAAGAGKRTAVFMSTREEPELMYRMLTDGVITSLSELAQRFAR